MIRLKRLYANDFKQLKEIDLVFPDAGRILVRGKNEAGKSTLFEAVFFALFGQPLITESGAHSLADLVGYGHEQCRVELDVQIRDTLYKIERNVKIKLARNADTLAEKREGTQKAALTVVRGDEVESVEGIRAVNARLERELGFDAETLLNTCFVEQKKLDKLETTARKEREHALAKLLNLDALVELEQDLEVTRDDRDRLARLEMRWELARAQAALPPVEEELAQVERALNLAELKKQLVDAGGKVQAINSLKAELEQARPRANEAAARAERAQLLREAVNEIKNGVTALDANARQQEQLEHERAEAVEGERQDRANAPRVQAQIQELAAQVARANRLARVELIQKESAAQIEKWQARLGEVQDARVRADEITARMQSEKARFDDLQARLRDYQLGAALDEWVQANGAAANGSSPEALDAKRRERQQLEARARRNLIGSAVSLLFGAIISFAAFFVLLGLRFDLPVALGISALLFVLTLVLAAFLIVRTIRTYLSLTETAQQLGQLEKQDEAASLMRRAAEERIQKANAQFAVLGVPIPRDAAFAQARRVELASKLADKSQGETSQELQNVQVNLIALGQKHKELAETSRDGETETLSRQIEQCRQVQRHAAHVLDKYGASLGGRTAIDLNRSLDRARIELEGLQSRLNRASQRAAQFDSRGEMLQAGLKEILATVTRAAQVTGIPSPAFADGLTTDSLREYGKQVQDEYQRAGGSQANEEAKRASATVAAKEGELTALAGALENLWQTAHDLAVKLKVDKVPDTLPAPDALEEWAGQLDAPGPDEREEFDRRAKRLRERRGRLRGTMDDLDAKLALGGEFLDEPETRLEYERFERETRVRTRAVEIAATARRRVMLKVLPATMDYMRRLLPQLTRERYHDAELDPESFKIKVWDERGRGWKEKNIFSGGTKDQLSLALRLAFALATLPQERNTAPGFIFLDEPLGAFDDERADALIELLTSGEVAHAFDQIFLISHVRVNAEHFTHWIALENGRVVDGNLQARVKE